MNFRFPPPPISGHSVVKLENVSKSYGPIRILDNYSFEIVKGDRIAIVGVNGAGKSTFSRIISGNEAPDSGKHTFGSHAALAFFSQTHADELDPTQTVLESGTAAASRETAPLVRSILGCFLFRGDDVFKSIGGLSGGERSRVALVRMLLHPANFLILDEPTNHLDFQSQEVLQKALLEYPGSYCIVSHNRSFLDPIVNKVLEFRPGQSPRVFPGNVSAYLEQIEMEERRADMAASSSPPVAKTSATAAAATGDRKAQRRIEAEIRSRKSRILKPLQDQLAAVENDIAQREQRKEEIAEQLNDPAIASDNDALMNLTTEYRLQEKELEALFTKWADLSEEIEHTEREIEAQVQ